MKIWKNTNTLNGYDVGLNFTNDKCLADIAILGSKPFKLLEFPKLKGIFRVGIGKENIPEKMASDKNILVRFPSQETIEIIYNETASFTCSLIFKMLYSTVGDINKWIKYERTELSRKSLLVIGNGNIGQRVADYMAPFMKVCTYDIAVDAVESLNNLIRAADCITLHIPMIKENNSFMCEDKLALMKDNAALINTSRGSIVDEAALYKEISTNRLRASFDVYWQEPYYGKLSEFYPDRFYMTPHIASTCSGFLKGCRVGVDNLIKEIKL